MVRFRWPFGAVTGVSYGAIGPVVALWSGEVTVQAASLLMPTGSIRGARDELAESLVKSATTVSRKCLEP